MRLKNSTVSSFFSNIFWGLFCCVCLYSNLAAQSDSLALDSRSQSDSLASFTNVQDSIKKDSTAPNVRSLPFAPGVLDDKVTYGAKDSMYMDVAKKQVHLYGNAFVKYTTIDLKAGYILLDYEKNEVIAEPKADWLGQNPGIPEFKDGDQAFTAQKLRYNFKSKKGIIYEARTQQESMYVLGEKAKFSSHEIQTDSGTVTENIIYNKDAIITSCNHEEPHFGIRTKKLKVIPNKLVIAGLSNLEIEGVPTPFFLPFGFYPITKDKKSGLILPRDFQFNSQSQGLGMQDIGYYLPINEYMDLTTKFDIFVRGTYKIGGDLRYKKRYRNSGLLAIEYNSRKQEDNFANFYRENSFGIRWNHSQDAKAHPTRKFGGNVNIQTNRNNNRVRNDFQSVYNNTLSSNMTYSQIFPDKPYTLSASFNHSQNNQTRVMQMTLPNLQFNMRRIYPFKRKETIGKEKFYEKISLTYSSSAQNSLRGVDTSFFTQKTLQNAQFGVQHKASSDVQIKFLNFNIAPNFSYEENWYGRSTEYGFDPTIIPAFDTLLIDGEQILALDSAATAWGKIDTITNWGFKSYRTFNASVSANTNLYFTKRFKRGWLRGVRHVMTPSVSIGFGPDYSENERFFREYQYTNRPGIDDPYRDYSIFNDAIFGKPSNSQRNVSLSYSLRNVLEMKYFSKKDTIGNGLVKKNIFKNLTFSGSYSLTADSLKWSTIGTGGSVPLFKGFTNVNYRLTFDPYITDPISGKRINKFAIREEGRLLRLTTLSTTMSTRTTIKKLRGYFTTDADDLSRPTSSTPPPTPGTPSPTPPNINITNITFAELLDDISINHYIQFNRELQNDGRDTFLIRSHTMGISGAIPLTNKWDLRVSNISYDFKAKSLVYPDIGLQRDLHCWTLDFSWQPVRGTFNFTIFVNDGALNFLKLPYRRNNLDAPLGF